MSDCYQLLTLKIIILIANEGAVQMVEIAIPQELFADILNRIERLRLKPAPA